jgi:hypothetical protein
MYLQTQAPLRMLAWTCIARYRGPSRMCYVYANILASIDICNISHPITDISARHTPPETHGFFTTPATIQAHAQHYWLNLSYPMEQPFYAGTVHFAKTRIARFLTFTSQNPFSFNPFHRRPSRWILFHPRRPNGFSRSRARGSSVVRTLPQLGQTRRGQLGHT